MSSLLQGKRSRPFLGPDYYFLQQSSVYLPDYFHGEDLTLQNKARPEQDRGEQVKGLLGKVRPKCVEI